MNMFHVRRTALPLLLLAAPLAALAAGLALPPLQDPVAEYTRRAAQPAPIICDTSQSLLLPVALSDTERPETSYDAATGRLQIFFHMEFNDLTEGWNWHPEEVAAGRDYYTYKYLPLGSTQEDHGSYPVDELSGEHLDYPVQWRYDYFFTFDNPYAFYPRKTDDATGFTASVAVGAADAARLASGDLRMAVRVRLRADCLTDSNTFFKGMPSQPRDFLLKKRYLIGTLEEVFFYDQATSKVLVKLAAH